MNAFAQLDASEVRSLPGEQLLAIRVLMGRKVSRLIDAELDRRATETTCPAAVVESSANVQAKSVRRRRAA